ncbi:MAG: hypothetical protein ABI627_02815 [Polyangiaceae bacterium]
MSREALIDTAGARIAGSKGLLAMVESNPTCNKPLSHRAARDRAARRGEYRATLERATA